MNTIQEWPLKQADLLRLADIAWGSLDCTNNSKTFECSLPCTLHQQIHHKGVLHNCTKHLMSLAITELLMIPPYAPHYLG